MSYQKIIFKQARKHVDKLLEKPKPSISFIPEWFKNQKLFSNGEQSMLGAEKKTFDTGKKFHGTYKLCVPVTDSMSAGYMLTSSASIMVINKSKEDYNPEITWGVDFAVIDSQNKESLGNYPIPKGHYKQMYRWKFDWKIITPKGYSLWITHPSHRYDLPFTTLNGFVDTDKHANPLYLPFFIKDGYEGVIQAGTPIAQIIPIKREDWKSFEGEYSEQEEFNFNNFVKLDMVRTYKNRYWSKKKYE